jgi:uncharacterized protein (TIGR03435 family)
MILKYAGVALAVSLTSVAQTDPSARPEFAVASVKRNHANCCAGYGLGDGKLHGNDVTLRTLIAWAYQVQQFQISGGPSWIASDRFDVEAKTEDQKADYAHLRLMLQSLLEDRFKVKLHRDTKELPVYSLVVAKGGPKIRLSPDQTSPDAHGPAPTGAGPNRGGLQVGAGMLIGNAVSLPQFATILSRTALDRLAIDKTNLAGRFDIQLQWAFDTRESPSDPGGTTPSPASPSDYPSIFTAIQEQLGLKLESSRGPVEVLVIDHAERPSQN